MKELVTINDIKSSVHASVHTESLAGFGQGGFDGSRREEAMRVPFGGNLTALEFVPKDVIVGLV